MPKSSQPAATPSRPTLALAEVLRGTKQSAKTPQTIALNRLRFHRQVRSTLEGTGDLANEWPENGQTPHEVLADLQRQAEHSPHLVPILTDLQGLAKSIATVGLQYPIRCLRDGEQFRVQDGHRRVLALTLLNRTEIDAFVLDAPSDLENILTQFVVNVQRSDLTPLERARALGDIIVLCAEKESIPIKAISDLLDPNSPLKRSQRRRVRDVVLTQTGFGEKRYYQLLDLLQINPAAHSAAQHFGERALRHLVQIPRELQPDAAQKAVQIGDRESDAVACLREIRRQLAQPGLTPRLEVDLQRAQEDLRQALGTKVELQGTADNGRLVIHFYSDEQLQSLYQWLSQYNGTTHNPDQDEAPEVSP